MVVRYISEIRSNDLYRVLVDDRMASSLEKGAPKIPYSYHGNGITG